MAVNLVRLVTLAVIGHFWMDIFHVSHVYLWQVTLLLMIVVTWVLWARWAARATTGAPVTPSVGAGESVPPSGDHDTESG
jgi:hypothetical protein